MCIVAGAVGVTIVLMSSSSLEESEDDFMDRFWGGLNRDIQEILIHEECYPMDHVFHLACKAEQEIKRRVGHEENKRMVHIPSVGIDVSSTTRCTITTTSVLARTTPSPPCDTSPPRVPTSSNLIIRGHDKGTDFPLSHENDACLVNLNTSCVELPIDLSTPPILETRVTVMNASCDQTTEIPTILSAPIKLTIDAKEPMFNHFDMTSNDRGKGVPSFDEMMDIALVEVDFDDPTTNVRGRRALAIAKPTPRGY